LLQEKWPAGICDTQERFARLLLRIEAQFLRKLVNLAAESPRLPGVISFFVTPLFPEFPKLRFRKSEFSETALLA
jgi:hypothetical protein